MGTTGKTACDLLATAAGRAAALLAGFVVVGATAGATWGVQDVLLTRAAPDGALTVEGSISGVRAGAPAVPLRLTLRNAGPRDRTVTRVTTTVVGASSGPASCAGGHLRVGDWAGEVAVPAGGARTVTVPVTVGNGLPAGCHDVVWRLRYVAS